MCCKNANQAVIVIFILFSSRLAKKIDTSETTINLEELIPGVTYELVVKAGNANGTSQLTPPIKFVTADKYIIESKGNKL